MRLMFPILSLWSLGMLLFHWPQLREATRTVKGFFLLCVGVSWGLWLYIALVKHIWYPTVWLHDMIERLLPF
ncbi:hypothetical protein [Ectobacillus ponti]|uniref:Uncharacterized protein n=1 Tax=Ectobacillus ponti TaxID=2961894 RepID=A0AA41XCY3_9BACI|nr:hypothetical protein [Ectobacillus ponti]MCP8971059.1 hypothetical protein [Ectobacillus ponti]